MREQELTETLAAMSARIDALEAEREIMQLLHSYGPALDYGDEAGWAECFTADGRWETGGPGASSARKDLRGTAELVAFAEKHTRAPGAYHKHCTIDPLITVEGDRATSVAYFLRVDGIDGGPVIFAFGRYHDELVRGGDGRWRIAHRRAEIERTGPTRA
jgi:SnoaL-like domain